MRATPGLMEHLLPVCAPVDWRQALNAKGKVKVQLYKKLLQDGQCIPVEKGELDNYLEGVRAKSVLRVPFSFLSYPLVVVVDVCRAPVLTASCYPVCGHCRGRGSGHL